MERSCILRVLCGGKGNGVPAAVVILLHIDILIDRVRMMLPGADDRASIDRAYTAGATDYFQKSATWALLPHRVRYILRSSDAARELRSKQISLVNAQRIAHMGNWRWEFESGELYWSREVYRIFGVSPNAMDLTYDVFASFVHEKDRERVSRVIEKALSEGSGYHVEHRINRADGEMRIILENGEPVHDLNGNLTGIEVRIG